MDNKPVFCTGVASSINIDALLSLLCKSCKKNIKKIGNDSNDLCDSCIAQSKKCDKPNEVNLYFNHGSAPTSSAVNQNYEISTPNPKRTLLPAPVDAGNLNSDLNNSRKSPISLNNSPELSLADAVPNHSSRKLKWKSSVQERFHPRLNASPYHNRFNRRSEDNIKNQPGPPTLHVPQRRSFPGNQNFYDRSSPFPSWSPPAYNKTDPLSGELWQLFYENRQTDDVFNKKMALRDKLHDILRHKFPSSGLYVVGSSMTGLGVKSSDIDMCLMLTDSEVDQQKEAIGILHSVKFLFKKYRFLHDIQVIYAKVPILKFVDLESGIEVDLNINNTVGIRNTQLLTSYSRIDKRLPPLVVLVKIWARCHDINDAKNNSLSSYSIVLMVIHYLQCRCRPPVLPCLQLLQPDRFLPDTDIRQLKLQEELPNFVSENYEDLGSLFIGFLKYFAEEFNFEEDVMSVRLGRVIPKIQAIQNSSPKNKQAHWKFICIEEPFDFTNTARVCFDEVVFEHIHHTFIDSYNRITKISKLSSILNDKIVI
ncbi:poly(A) RNA polymerase gld-2 homolog A [Caerostris darwini]|uniref:Poly(A) RNA polymerase gld-2 homolog A n=1 Tax=Caerostris darwini TaxID=1538125 RepID=A0AAV4WAF1_9ARAC|nr:poly(A) RNA polymerase gld-2 homolog A [Caerostris darwini]